MEISYIVLTYNDHTNLELTLNSLEKELLFADELILVDSSDNKNKTEEIIDSYNFNCNINYFYIKPEGVFPAYNFAIKKSSKQFIQKINSGDTLIKGSRSLIHKNLKKNADFPIQVYSQKTTGVPGNDLIFSPSENSLWPLQSVICRKDIFEDLGFYNDTYKYNADQNFFMEARRIYKYIIYKNVITTYDSFGISSGLNLKHFKEHFVLRRLQGKNIFSSFFLAGIRPFIRLTIQKFLGDNFAFYLKSKVFKHYRSAKK